MMATVRAIVSIPLGVVVGMAMMVLLLTPCFLMYPLPSGIDLQDPSDAEAFGHHLASLPFIAFVLVWIAHAGGSFSGAAFGRFVEGDRVWKESLAIGGIFTAMGLVNAVSMAFPFWFILIDLALYLPAAILGGWGSHALLLHRETRDSRKASSSA
ncbi:hypothetical protein ACYFX5_11035 [Bremerella sp. T1]|uniref:hypothetical protein n=1 Tax=Bremerella sp. TYQ1 TaxID=3119568 RepID=UPI001CCCA502|nr:hypothetical protein [Bremerella volcania]UBM38782.1 hypothetical protein LA756_12980 [Bremerella volcania]